MERKNFLKSIALAFLAPSVLIPEKTESKPVAVYKHRPEPSPSYFPHKKSWPIYPDKNEHLAGIAHGNETILCYKLFTYVKINRNGVDYLIPVREDGYGDHKKVIQRFENDVNWIRDNYKVDNWQLDNKIIYKYNPQIHVG